MKKILAICLALCLLLSFAACSKSDNNNEQSQTQATEAAQTDIQPSDRIVEPTNVEGTGSQLTAKDYSFTAFGKTYTLAQTTLQEFLDDGWTIEDEYADANKEIDSYSYLDINGMSKDGVNLYYLRFVNFSKSSAKPLSECKLLQFAINYSGVNIVGGEDQTATGADVTTVFGFNEKYCMADVMDKFEAVGIGHYEQDYDTYYTLRSNQKSDDPDINYTIEAHFSHDTQKLQAMTVYISTYTNGEFDEA